MKHRLTLFIAAALAALAMAAPAEARTLIVGDQADRWQAAVDASQISTPDLIFPITVRIADCPNGGVRVRGCADVYSATIYLTPDVGETDRAFLHELGHMVDAYALDGAERADFQARLFPALESIAWGDETSPTPPLEWFAEAFYSCSADRDAPAPGDADRPHPFAYGFDPSISTAGYVDLCRQLDRDVDGAGVDQAPAGAVTPPASPAPAPRRVRRCRTVTKTRHVRRHGRRVKVKKRIRICRTVTVYTTKGKAIVR